MTHRPLFGAGAQTLQHVPLDRLGRPTRITDATYTIVDLTEGTTSSSREVVASTAATLDGVETTLSAAAGRNSADSTLLPAVSDTGIVSGRRLLLSTLSDSGQRELVTVERVGSGVFTRRDVRGVYASGDRLQGVELAATFPASVADDEDLAIRDGNDYQIVWSYSIDGQPYLVPERISVERYSSFSWVGPQEVLRGKPSLARRIDASLLQETLSLATEEVEGELEASQTRPEYYRPTKAGRTATRYLTLALLYDELGNDDDQDKATNYRARFRAQIHQMIDGRPAEARMVSRQDDTSHAPANNMGIFVPA